MYYIKMQINYYSLSWMLAKEIWVHCEVKRTEGIDGVRSREISPLNDLKRKSTSKPARGNEK